MISNTGIISSYISVSINNYCLVATKHTKIHTHSHAHTR